MSNAFIAQMTGGAFALIAVFSAAAWAETPAPADISEEDAYLDVLPKVEIPDELLLSVFTAENMLAAIVEAKDVQQLYEAQNKAKAKLKRLKGG